MGRVRWSGLRAAGLVLALAVLSGCSSKAEPPSPDDPPPPAPDLSGRSVMLLPLQGGAGVDEAALDAELAYWLGERGASVRWVLPPALESALERSPALSIPLRSLPVAAFRRARMRRIGDPLYGHLRLLGALVDARYALLPVAAAYAPDSTGGGRMELMAALVDTLGGAVLWFTMVQGDPGAPDDPVVAATAARALARSLFP